MHCNREICYTKDKQVITEKKIIVTKGRTEMLCNILKKNSYRAEDARKFLDRRRGHLLYTNPLRMPSVKHV